MQEVQFSEKRTAKSTFSTVETRELNEILTKNEQKIKSSRIMNGHTCTQCLEGQNNKDKLDNNLSFKS
jgi:hypothetical protein